MPVDSRTADRGLSLFAAAFGAEDHLFLKLTLMRAAVGVKPG
jgi:hypothetical protein